MDTRAPSVVAVVVTTDPDAHLEATLSSLVAQDYDELSILVMGTRPELTLNARVAAVAPGAFVAVCDTAGGFGAAVNQALAMVEGSSFLLLCHDDVVLEPDAVHLLVEEAFRSNAGIVTPKVVSIDDASVLLHVGQGVDRYGTIIERVQPGEVDQGQHDAVRDVFVAPGGVTLVRDDLLRSLGGYDPRYLAMGDDLELCWRARLAGARIVCAPQAVVAHAERLAAGAISLTVPEGEHAAPTLSRLRRRNELRTIIICWGLFQRTITLAMLAVLNLLEIIISVTGGDAERAVDIRESWRVWFRERKEDRAARNRVKALRTVSDRSIRSLQTRGATRARIFVATLAHHGFDAARGAWSPLAEEPSTEAAPELTASFGGAFSEDEGFDELDDLGRRGRRAHGRRRLASPRAVLVLTVALAIVFLIGSRNLMGARLPMIGQLVPLGSWSSVWHRVFASWQPAGLGNGAPGHPGYLTLGLVGTVTLGQMGFAVRLILLTSLPLGALGTARLIAPVASARARLLAAAAFFGLALGVNSIAGGDLGAVAALGAMPFVIRRVLRLLAIPPFDVPFDGPVSIAARGWRRTVAGQIVALGLLLGFVGALSPALLVATALVALGGAVGAWLARAGNRGAGLARVGAALGLAVVLLAPLTIQAVAAGAQGLAIFGVPQGPWSTAGPWGLLRFAVGPNGDGILTWLLPLAAVVPLLIARKERLALAASVAGAGAAALALAVVVAHGGLGPFAPDLLVLLAPVAVGVAALVGLGLAAFEIDLPGVDFGWRQVVGLLGVAAALVGLIPFVVDAGNGRWHMPTSGYGDALSFLNAPAKTGHRVLWLGDPRGIPGGSWGIHPGLAWATSTDGLPTAANLFAPAAATGGSAITVPITTALEGNTVHLGQLLAPTGISQIVVVTSTAPTLPGISTAESVAPPAGLLPALRHQLDLQEIPGSGSAVIFDVAGSMPVVATRRAPLSSSLTPSFELATQGWRSLVGSNPLAGQVRAGDRTAFAGRAPASDFSLQGSTGTSSSAFGWAQTWPVRNGQVSLRLSALPVDALVAVFTMIAWLALVLCLIGRHRWLDWWWRRPKHVPHLDPVELEEQLP